MRKALPYILVGLLLMLGTQVAAQSGLRDKVLEELDRTDQLIRQAEEQLQSTDNPAGQAFLEQAKLSQQQARDAFAESHFVEARRLTLMARDLLRKALKVDRAAERGNDQTLRRLERAEDKLDRARDALAETESEALMVLLESATENLKRAWEFYNTGQLAPALRLAEQVEKAAERILSNCGGSSTANYERRLETVRDAVELAKDAVTDCQSDKGRTYLTQAEKALELAEQLSSNGRIPAALAALQQSKNLANRAYQACAGMDNLQERYRRLLNDADQLREKVQTLGADDKESVGLLLNKTYEQLELAKAALDAGSAEKAAPALQAASLTIRQAEEIILETN